MSQPGTLALGEATTLNKMGVKIFGTIKNYRTESE